MSGMQFDGKDEALAREAERDAKVTPIRKGRGTRAQNKVAAKDEALGNGVTFDFDGKSYHLAPAEDWDLDVMEHFSEGNMLAAVKALFEEEQYKAFRTGEDGETKIKRTNRDLAEFVEAAMKALGVEPGESNS